MSTSSLAAGQPWPKPNHLKEIVLPKWDPADCQHPKTQDHLETTSDGRDTRTERHICGACHKQQGPTVVKTWQTLSDSGGAIRYREVTSS